MNFYQKLPIDSVKTIGCRLEQKHTHMLRKLQTIEANM